MGLTVFIPSFTGSPTIVPVSPFLCTNDYRRLLYGYSIFFLCVPYTLITYAAVL